MVEAILFLPKLSQQAAGQVQSDRETPATMTGTMVLLLPVNVPQMCMDGSGAHLSLKSRQMPWARTLSWGRARVRGVRLYASLSRKNGIATPNQDLIQGGQVGVDLIKALPGVEVDLALGRNLN